MSRATKQQYSNPFGPPSPDLQCISLANETDFVLRPETQTIPQSTNAAILTNPFDAVDSKSETDIVPLSPRRTRDIIPTNINPNEPYKYNTNHSRGAMILNDYDSERTTGALDYKFKKTDAMLPRHVLLFRKALYVAQMMIIAGGAIITGGAYIAENSGWQFSPNGLIYGHMEAELIYVPYACGIVSIITAVIGFVGTKTREECGNAMLITYLVFLAITLALSTASAAQAFADRGNAYHYAQRQWNRLTVTEERIFEWENFCCNFDTLEPCCRFGYGVTDCVNEYMCFERVELHLVKNFNVIAFASLLHTISLIGITVSAAVLLGYLSYKDRKKMEKEEASALRNEECVR